MPSTARKEALLTSEEIDIKAMGILSAKPKNNFTFRRSFDLHGSFMKKSSTIYDRKIAAITHGSGIAEQVVELSRMHAKPIWQTFTKQ